MATGEDHPELAVFNLTVQKEIVNPLVLVGPGFDPDSGGTAGDFLAPKRIQNFVFGDAMNPAGWILGHPSEPPRVQGIEEGCLHHLFDEIEVAPAEETSQHRYQSPRLPAKEMLDERSDWFRW